MKIKPILITAFITALIIAYFTWSPSKVMEISALQLSAEYASNPDFANQKYFDKMLLVNGKVKAYYKILGARPVLELETGSSNIPVFFFFLSQENEFYAGQLQSGQHVTIKGKCTGDKSYSFVKGVKIEAEEFEEK